MKKFIISAMALTASIASFANGINVPEPEFLHSYIYLTSDSTFSKLQKEHGAFQEHQSKLSKFAQIGSAASGLAAAGGMAMVGLGTSTDAMIGGLRTVTTATSVGMASSSLSLLSGYEGMDIVFEGKNSPNVIPAGADVNIIYRETTNDIDPQEIMRVVKFKGGKKDRKMQWFNISPALLSSKDANKKGYIYFDAKKYGDQSYLITIPTAALDKGEYGIIIGGEANAGAIPVATFSIQ